MSLVCRWSRWFTKQKRVLNLATERQKPHDRGTGDDPRCNLAGEPCRQCRMLLAIRSAMCFLASSTSSPG